MRSLMPPLDDTAVGMAADRHRAALPGLAARAAAPASRRATLQGLAALAAAGLPFARAHAAPTQRLVSIGGALTEIVYALDAQQALVGVDTTSLYPEAATRLPSIGYARTLSAEGILALAPTQVVATEDAGPPAVLRQIADTGVPVNIVAAHHRFEGVLERIERLGALLDRATVASRLTTRLKADWQRVRAPILARQGTPPRVLFILSNSPNQIMVGGRGSSADAVIDYAGGRNAVQGFDGFKPLTPEAVVAAQPDVLLFTQQGLDALGGAARALKLPGLDQTPAGHRQRVLALEAMFLLGFGPRLPDAVAALDAELTRVMRA